jgi:hypothetical protein
VSPARSSPRRRSSKTTSTVPKKLSDRGKEQKIADTIFPPRWQIIRQQEMGHPGDRWQQIVIELSDGQWRDFMLRHRDYDEQAKYYQAVLDKCNELADEAGIRSNAGVSFDSTAIEMDALDINA